MNLSRALVGLFAAAAAAAASPNLAKMSSHDLGTSLTASTVVKARRSVQFAVRVEHRRRRHRQLIATRAALLVVHHHRRRSLQDTPTGVPSDMSNVDPSAIEDMLASMGITVPKDANGDPDFEALAAQFGIDLDDFEIPDGVGSGGDGDMMGDFGDFDLDALLGGDFSVEDLMAGGDGADIDKELEDLMGGDMDMDDLDDLFGGLFGDGGDGDPAAGIGSLICSFMDMVDMEDMAGQTCDCDASSGDLVLMCGTTEEICDSPPEGAVPDGIDQGVEFCVSSATSTVIIPLDFADSMFDEDGNIVQGDEAAPDAATPEASVESCAIYSAPAYVANKEFCFKAAINLELDEMMGESTAMGDGTSDPATMENLSELIECEASINGDLCKSCSICDNGLGIELDCPGPGLFSESCTDVMVSENGSGSDASSPADTGLPTSTSIVRFAQATADSSPATDIDGKIGAIAVGGALAIFMASVAVI